MANVNYKKIRRYNTDIHVLEFKPSNDLQPILTAGDRNKRQVLSEIENDWMINQGYKPVAKINAGFFYYVSHVQTVGLDYYDWGNVVGQASLGGGAETIWTGDKLVVEDMSHETFMNEYYQKAHWGTSLSYRLVKDGKANTEFASRYDHANSANPRTMLGQKANGELVFAVAEGRNTGDKGLTAKEQANVMVELGCITAVNADGGGSSEMITYENNKKKIVNYLSDGSERRIGNAIVLYAKGDVTWNGNATNSAVKEEPTSSSANGRHIVLDAGHGGEDPGASGNGLIEKNVTLDVTLAVGKRLREHGFKVTYTRETDKNVGNAGERGKMMGSVGADYGLSIHVNSASSKSATGAEIIVPMKERYAYVEAALKENFSNLYKFRKVISRDYSTGQFYERGISGNRMFATSYSNRDYYGIVREAWAKGLSADIIELFFISNPDDVKFYSSHKQEYVEAIVKSICQGYSVTYVEPKKVEPTTSSKMYRAIAGSYTSSSTVDKAIAELSSKGFTGIWTQKALVSGKNYTRIICGSYANRETANNVVQKLIAAGYKDAWVNAVEV